MTTIRIKSEARKTAERFVGKARAENKTLVIVKLMGKYIAIDADQYVDGMDARYTVFSNGSVEKITAL